MGLGLRENQATGRSGGTFHRHDLGLFERRAAGQVEGIFSQSHGPGLLKSQATGWVEGIISYYHGPSGARNQHLQN